LLFFYLKSAFFLFFPVWYICNGFIFSGLSGIMLPAFYCVCLRPVFLLSVPVLVWFIPSGCFAFYPAVLGDYRGLYIQILLQVYQRQAGFDFFAGLVSGLGAWGLKRGLFGAFRGLWGFNSSGLVHCTGERKKPRLWGFISFWFVRKNHLAFCSMFFCPDKHTGAFCQ